MKSFYLNFKLQAATKLTLFLIALGMMTIFSSCSDDEDMDDGTEEPQTIVEVAIENGYSRLADALTEAGLVTTLQGDGPFTVFAPNNAAFEAAGVTAENDFGGLTSAELAVVLTYHVVSGNITSDQLTTGEVATVQGANITIDAENLTVNGVNIIEPFDVAGSNGTIHTIGSVLSIPVEAPQTIVDVAVAGGYSRLADALTEADLVTTLQGDGPFTVFAPTNAAFEAAGVTSENSFGGLSKEDLSAILTYHVVAGNITSDQLTTGDVATVQGENISIDAENLTINGVSIEEPFDVVASNGTIHTIGSVLSLPQNIVELAQSQENLSILVTALTKFSDLVTALSDENETYTVFAPTDEAFATLLGITGQSELDDIPESVIRRVLEYHVISGAAVLSTDLTDGQAVDPILTDEGDVITVGVGSSVTIDNATVVTADQQASNGVVHIIDGVLTPDLETSIVNTVVEPAYFNTDFEVLTSAVVKAGLLETLIDANANLTVFAPNDAAFEAIGITSVENLTAEALEPILLYHVLGSEVKAADLPATGSAVTTLGGDFYLSINDNGVFINGLTQVIVTDVDQDNGVVHVIDRTLQPASSDVVDIAIAASEASEGAEFTQLVAALTAVSEGTDTDLVTALKGDGPFTVFAPTDAAFQALYDAVGDANQDGSNDISDVVAAAGLETIATVLQYHVLSGRVFSTDIPNVLGSNASVTLSPLAGGDWALNSDLTITATDGALSIGLDDAAIEGTDILGTNGVIHTIDQVILP